MFKKKRFCLSRILGSCALNLNSTKITLRSSVNLLKHLVRYLCLFNYTKWLQMKPTCYNEERIVNPKKVQGTIKQGHLFLTRFQIANAIHRFYTTSEGSFSLHLNLCSIQRRLSKMYKNLSQATTLIRNITLKSLIEVLIIFRTIK